MTESVQIQKVLSDLNNLGWNTHDIYYYKQEVDLESKRRADIVLYRAGKPIGLIEVKKLGFDLLSNVKQSLLLADDLNVKLIYITDGNLIYQIFKDSSIAIQCHNYVAVSELELVKII
jgi:type I site-specific restriction endonuclease